MSRIRSFTGRTQKATVVLDAGVATEDNLKLLVDQGYDYVCVSRTKIKDYKIDPSCTPIKVFSKANDEITLEKVISGQTTDYLLKVQSPGKFQKEQSMKRQFEERFTKELDVVKQAFNKKGGVKKIDKVERRIGRVIERYPSIAKHYNIEIKSVDSNATDLVLTRKGSYQENEEHIGTYFIRTNLNGESQKTLWDIYNTIREIENSFRCLKTDLDLRPIYHKSDQGTLAHLHLGLLAYWIVNTIRYQLKAKNIRHDWQEIIRITNTQKVVTTYAQNTFGEMLYVRRCTEPSDKVQKIYSALGYKNYPFVRKKSVVHKPELEKKETQEKQAVNDS